MRGSEGEPGLFGLDGRLRQARRTLQGDRSFLTILGVHHAAMLIAEDLSRGTSQRPAAQTAVLISTMVVLYREEMAGLGIFAEYVGDPKKAGRYPNLSPHFMAFAIARLPEGRSGTVLKARLSEILKAWRTRNPGEVIVPLACGKPVNETIEARWPVKCGDG